MLDEAMNVTRTEEASDNQLQDIRGIQAAVIDALKYDPYIWQPSAQANLVKD